MVPQVYNEQACVVCNEAITNPVCKHCLEEEMASWLSDHGTTLHEIALKATETFPHVDVSEVNCILCKEKMEVCPHCYAKEVLCGLRHTGSDIQEKFARAFNFDLF